MIDSRDAHAARTPPGSPRSFGLSVGAVLLALAGALMWRRHPLRAEVVGAFGAVLLAFGAAWPSLLAQPSRWWWRVARVVGEFNARVLLTIMFALVFVPLGFFWRTTGRDPLALRRRSKVGWQPYPERYRDPRHYQRMY